MATKWGIPWEFGGSTDSQRHLWPLASRKPGQAAGGSKLQRITDPSMSALHPGGDWVNLDCWRLIESNEVVEALWEDGYRAEKAAPLTRRHFDHPRGGATNRVFDAVILAR